MVSVAISLWNLWQHRFGDFFAQSADLALLSPGESKPPSLSSLLSGIDLSECLQYPDFSVVVLYKKVIIAFGFMVPDVKYNEAYISFLLVHPEWRRAGIATFMIYHLIQASWLRTCLCMGCALTSWGAWGLKGGQEA